MTDRYAVFGNPIAQSKSPQIHAIFAEQTQQDMVYEKHAIALDGFAAAADAFFSHGGCGLNITVPFKQEAFDYADNLSERSKLAGAVNTLKKNERGVIVGDNTDGVGLVRDITQRLAWEIQDKDVLVLGAGGAVRGVLLPLLLQQPKSLQIANRTVAKAQHLAKVFSSHGCIKAMAFRDLCDHPFDLVLNGTSASLSGEVPPITCHSVSEKTYVYDMVYGSKPTAFMRWAEEHGAAETSDGMGMLVGQAAESFSIWRGVEVKVEPALALLRR